MHALAVSQLLCRHRLDKEQGSAGLPFNQSAGAFDAMSTNIMHVALEYALPHLNLNNQLIYGGLGMVVATFLKVRAAAVCGTRCVCWDVCVKLARRPAQLRVAHSPRSWRFWNRYPSLVHPLVHHE